MQTPDDDADGGEDELDNEDNGAYDEGEDDYFDDDDNVGEDFADSDSGSVTCEPASLQIMSRVRHRKHCRL